MNIRKDFIRFIIKCICFPAAAVLIIFLLNKQYEKAVDEQYYDFMKFWTLGEEVDNIQIANTGSSHGAYDFVYDDLTARGYSCFNYGNTSQTFNYDYGVLKEYGDYMAPGCVLFIPVSYFSFNNEVVNESESQALSVKYYHFLSPENVPDYSLFTDIVTHRLPILSAGENILKLFPDLKLSLVAFAAEGEINAEEFAQRAQNRYDRHFNNKSEYFLPERIEELYDIIDYCKENEITPVLITTPFSKYYRDLVSDSFLQEFEDVVTSIAADTGVSYYDYSYDPRFRGHIEYFSDSDHLNDTGAAYFMQVLEAEVPELQAVITH